MIYNNKSSFFQDLLDKDNSVTINHRIIGNLAIETFKFLQGTYFEESFCRTRLQYTQYDMVPTRISFLFSSKNLRHLKYSILSKQKPKKWFPRECPCRLSKTYVPQVGFIRMTKIKKYM